MKHFEIRIPTPKKGDKVQIFSICCLHIGSKNYDEAKALSYRNYILKTPDTYAISLGDDVDLALPGDAEHNSMMFENNMSPEEQRMAAWEFWLPVAQKGKLLWTHDSNHWWRAEAKTGMSAARDMNVFLGNNAKKGRHPRWGRWQAIARILLGRQKYLVHSWHGAGGGSTAENALKVCRAKANEIMADLYLVGHFHKKAVYEDVFKWWPTGKSAPVEHTRAYAATGSFLMWDESYAERKGLPPAIRGAIKIELFSDRHEVRVSL